MKKIGILLMGILLNACQFNKSVQKDLITGAFSKGDGIVCDAVLIQINSKVEKRTNFINGEKIEFLFKNVNGLKRKDGNLYPGLSMHVIKNEQDTVLKQLDFFANLKNGTDISILDLKVHFTGSFPSENNETYKVYMKIWDKKGDGTFSYELPFSVEENKLLTINTDKLSYNNIYLWNETKERVITDKNVNVKDKLTLILGGIEGLEIIDNKVFPSFSIELSDNKGTQIMVNDKLLKKYKVSGIEPATIKNGQLSVKIVFP